MFIERKPSKKIIIIAREKIPFPALSSRQASTQKDIGYTQKTSSYS
jgi:hypothetical protein